MSFTGIRRRTLRDWTPECGPGDEWLAQLAAEGWVPEYGAGVKVQIHGRWVVRYALIESDERYAARQRPRRPEGDGGEGVVI